MIRRVFLQTIAVVVSVAKGWVGTIRRQLYVSSVALGGGSGTKDDPLKLSELSGKMQPGDTIWIKAGTYELTSTATPPVIRGYNTGEHS